MNYLEWDSKSIWRLSSFIENPMVMKAITLQGVDPVYVEVLQHIYDHSNSFIRLHKDSEPFQLQKGVRQDDAS